MSKKIIDLDVEIDRAEVAALKFDGDMMASIFGARDLWPSWVADMDFGASPNIRQALGRRVEHGVYGYESSSAALPAAVSAWYERRHRWCFYPDHILFSPRTLASISALVTLFSKEGDGVIIQPPVFYDFKSIVSQNRRRLIRNPLKLEQGRYRIDFDHLQAVASQPNNSLLILCNPHNPVGRVWTKKELLRISEICLAHDVYVIADEIHGDITYQRGYTPLASISAEVAANCASCISPVKSFNLAGVANSMIVIEDGDRRALCSQWYSRLEVNKNNIFSTAAMLAAYSGGEPWLDQVIDYLKENIDTLGSFLDQNLPMVKLVEPEGTYLVWLDFRDLGLDARQLASFLVKEARIAGNPGHWFGREGAGFARINIACPRSVLENALKNLQSAVKRLASGDQAELVS